MASNPKSVIDEEWISDERNGRLMVNDETVADWFGDEERLQLAVLAPRMARALLEVEYHATDCCGCTPECPECKQREPWPHEAGCGFGELCTALRAIAAGEVTATATGTGTAKEGGR